MPSLGTLIGMLRKEMETVRTPMCAVMITDQGISKTLGEVKAGAKTNGANRVCPVT